MITFIIGGLWHGAGWTFVFWGFLHGLALVIHRIWQKLNFKLNTIIAWFITFNFINISWIFFRAKEWDDALKVLGAMFSLDNVVLPLDYEEYFSFLSINFGEVYFHILGRSELTFWIIGAFLVILFVRNSMTNIIFFRANKFYGLLLVIFALAGILNITTISEFLYFNF